jgi:hypothetical protein
MSIYQKNTKNIWFPYQREPNPLDRDLFKAYWSNEKDRLINGFYLADNKVFIPGWLYWHTVYWTIEIDTKIGNNSFKGLGQPIFRDLDWEMAFNKDRAEKEQKYIELVGSRRFGKSVWDSSMAAYYYTLFDNTEACISGGNGGDISIVTKKTETGLTHLHPVFQKQRLKSNWSTEVRAGFKDKKTGNPSSLSSNSRIVMRNFQDGNNSMACNGLSPKFHVVDEIGKIPNLIQCINDTEPCWINSSGMFSVVIFSGTGGDMEVGKEAGDMFFSPEGYNILEFPDTWEHRGNIGWFVPATKAKNEYKFPQSLSKYLGIDHPDLQRVIIMVSDEEKCMKEFIEPARAKAAKTGNPATILKQKAYFPIKPSECFLVLSQNPFDPELCERQLFKIKHSGVKTGYPVELYLGQDDKVYHKSTDKMAITQFPVKSESMDAPILIYEFPIDNPPRGLYVAGIDPYKQDQATYSDSLGAVYIFKRMHDIESEKFQDMFVASYVARPGNKIDWYENTRLLLKFYNAEALCENEDVGFIDYMIINKQEGHYLAATPDWLKELHPNSTVKRSKGIHVTPKIRSHLNGKLESYQREVISLIHDDEGNKIGETTGTNKILDPLLLEEMIKYNNSGNFDRVVAASLAIAHARTLDPRIKISDNDDILNAYFRKEGLNPKSLFINPHSTFKRNKSRLFY